MDWHRVDDVTEGHRFMKVRGQSVVVINTEGRWSAIEDRCSHAGCAFSSDGEIDGHIAICNCHGSEFDVRTGEVLSMPAETPLRTYPVRQTGDVLEIHID